MNYQLLFCCLLICLFNCTESISQSTENKIKETKLQGKVKSVTTTNYDAVEKGGVLIKGARKNNGLNKMVLYNVQEI